jgi:DNA gyrase subunit B
MAAARNHPVGAYGASAIKVLKGLDAVRKRPGMYIGSTGERGLHHLVWEVVDNAVDEAMAGFATTISVTLLRDGGVEVADDGRGIPVEMHESGRPAIDVVMTELHAGGKFDRGSYKVSGGLHGVGISVVNALSTRVEVDVCRDGYSWRQFYENTVPGTLKRCGATKKTGSVVRFWADPTIFETTEYNVDVVARRLQEMAFLNAGLTISLLDDRFAANAVDGKAVGDTANSSKAASGQTADAKGGARRIFHYPDGLLDYIKDMNGPKGKIHNSIIDFSGMATGHENDIEVEVAMQWNAGHLEAVYTFANTIRTHEGGTHEEGFRSALTAVVNRYAKERKLLKVKSISLTGDDIREGLAAVLSVKVGEPQFEGQTKTKLGNSGVRSIVQRVCHEKLTRWFDANPADAKLIIAKATSSAQARLAAETARKQVHSKSAVGLGGLPGKLSDCRSTDPIKSEVFVVEGDSAGGSAKSGRDSMFQAILPLRGKIINVEKMRLDRVLKNTEIQAIITALGTGIHDEFDITKLRYHKIVLMADADVDGQHISTLLLTLLFRFMKPLVENGHVFLAQPPLYKLKWQRSEPEFAYSDRERDGLLKTGLAAGRKINQDDGIQRYKGLGEMDASELWETTMDPTVRVLRQITLDDAAAADELFSVLMGEDVDARRTFITRNAKDVRFLDV